MTLQIRSDLVAAAVEAAREGGEIAVQRQSAVTAEDKGDGTSVTAADREVEARVREILADRTAYPVWGEETNDEPDGPSYWVVDPIDGTRNYADGLPMYATSVAAVVDGQLTACAISVPELNDVWYAERGEGAYRNDEQVSVSGGGRPEGATLCAAGYRADVAHDVSTDVNDWVQRFTAAVYSILTVAGGSNDACVVSRVYPWDIAGGALLVREAGGRVTTFDGHTSWQAIRDGGVIAWNGSPELEASITNVLTDERVTALSTLPSQYQNE